ncbi:hypothetical protein KFE25_007944 [Diacronema lutheri]|uniref:Photosystem II Psb31 protein domain-containing protein n=1 Tax=Diacronema lutheri TaxID=2081491 RepID=A0A8J6CE54_DIALT|nr:hypothetical protein KFE25_007944 [Diacronema lutheri]
MRLITVVVHVLAVAGRPARPRPSEIGRRGAAGIAVGGLVLSPRAASADGAESLLTQQTARARYGPRLLRLREVIGDRHADVNASLAEEAIAVHLFTSGAFARGSERARRLQALEKQLHVVAAAGDAGGARQALDDIIETGEIRYVYASTGTALAGIPQAPSATPARAPPRPNSPGGSSVALVAAASAILALALSKNAMSSLVELRKRRIQPTQPTAEPKTATPPPLPPPLLGDGARDGTDGPAAAVQSDDEPLGDGKLPADVAADDDGGPSLTSAELSARAPPSPPLSPPPPPPPKSDRQSAPAYPGVVERSRVANGERAVAAAAARAAGRDAAGAIEGDPGEVAEPSIGGIPGSALQLLDLDH